MVFVFYGIGNKFNLGVFFLNDVFIVVELEIFFLVLRLERNMNGFFFEDDDFFVVMSKGGKMLFDLVMMMGSFFL